MMLYLFPWIVSLLPVVVESSREDQDYLTQQLLIHQVELLSLIGNKVKLLKELSERIKLLTG